MPGGRPEIKIDVKKVKELASRGLTMEQIASYFGFATSVLYRQKAKYKELQEAIKEGQAKGIKDIANALYEKAKAGDTAASIFYLKARAGWKDKIELSGNQEEPVRHVILSRAMSAEEWEKEYSAQKEADSD